ncbi:hypothetical protein CHLRE_07g325726v5 [Chlamydomonas reinhardtii]|uniref:Uncharacterized protein n=1 Tax=Chlamydomonas reinhardtii TaxID=3055 RepID=A0A2K3DJE9_CHLRE|nr:uncharacterized protein CHLRE_07g325726v5 [Chlamydomonas reinhardtii]PNW80652.1 hypothetical protein CHLRE_07g325726v5 [Chlamydomonas reinhardtii]
MAEVQRRANIKATDSINHQLVALGLRAPLHTVLGCLSFNRRGIKLACAAEMLSPNHQLLGGYASGRPHSFAGAGPSKARKPQFKLGASALTLN